MIDHEMERKMISRLQGTDPSTGEPINYDDPMRELTPFLDADTAINDEFLDECVEGAERDFSEIRVGVTVPAPSAIQIRAERTIALVKAYRKLDKEFRELHSFTHEPHVFEPECRLCVEKLL